MEKQDFGQHFLTNEEVLKKEVEIARIDESDRVIEIGTGDGRLTREILKKTESFISFEIDKEREKELKKEFGEKVAIGNAVDYSWEGYNKIIANIPYYLSEQVVVKAIREGIEEMVLIVGENFKNKLEKSEENVGKIARLFFEFNPVMKIKKEDFTPKPRVNSWLIILKKKTQSRNERILQNVFLRKGKIKNAIIYSLVNEGLTKNQSRQILDVINLDENILEDSTKRVDNKILSKLRDSLKLKEIQQFFKDELD